MAFYSNIPFFRFFVPFLLGIFLFSFSVFQQDIPLLLIALFALLLLVFFVLKKHSSPFLKKTFTVIVHLIFVLIGVQAGYIYQNTYGANDYKKIISNKPEFFTGYISDIPQQKEKGIKAEITLLNYKQQNKWQETKGRVIAYFTKDEASLRMKYGNIIVFKNNLQEIEAPMNPYEFDYKNYLQQKNICHQAYLKNSEWKNAGEYANNSILSFSLSLKNHLIHLLRNSGFNKEQFSIISALLLGYDDEINKDLINSYAHSGTLHVLSVSGLHVGTIYLFLNFILGFNTKNKKLALFKCLLIISCLSFYAMLSGLAPAVLRATLMFSMIIIGKTFFKMIEAYNILLVTAFFILLFNPLLIYDVGFQLSYLAMLGIFYFQPKLYQLFSFNNWIADKIWALTTMSIAAQITTFPISIYYFHQFSVLFVLSNLIIIPLSSAVMYVGIFLLALSSFQNIYLLLSKLLIMLISWMNEFIIWFEKIPESYLDNLDINKIETVLFYLCIVFISAAIYNKSFQQIRYSIFCLALGTMISISTQLDAIENNNFYVYQVKRQTIIDLFKGTRAISFTSSTNKQAESFHCENNRIKHKIDSVQHINIQPGLTLIEEANRKIIIANNIQQNSNLLSHSLSCDYLIVCGKNTSQVNDLIEQLKPKHIIVDGSVNKKLIEKIKTETGSIPLWICSERGAYCDVVR